MFGSSRGGASATYAESALGIRPRSGAPAPNGVTATWWRKDRDLAKLFVDYNQNARDHTIASVYSVRGGPEAVVSTPISWDEVDDVEPRDCTIATVPDPFRRLGDLHQGIDDAVYSLETLLDWADRDALA